MAWWRRRSKRREAERQARAAGTGADPRETAADAGSVPGSPGSGGATAAPPDDAQHSAGSGAGGASRRRPKPSSKQRKRERGGTVVPPVSDSIPWRYLDDGVYLRLLGPLADDPDVGRILDLCARGDAWSAKARRLLAETPDITEVLGRLVAKEEPIGPDATAFVGGVISALGSLPAESAVPLLVRLADQKSGLTRGSTPLARSAIRTLGTVRSELVPPQLHRLASESPLDVLRKAAYGELKRQLNTLSDAPEWSVDSFGLDADSRLRITVGSQHTAKVWVATGGRVQVAYLDAAGRTLAGKPTATTLDPAAMAEVTALVRNLRAAVRAAKTRLESAQNERREIPTTDWLEHYLDHPVTGQLARTLLWELRSDAGRQIGLPRRIEGRWCLVTMDNERLVPGDEDLLCVAMLRDLDGREARGWIGFLAKAKVQPVLAQVFTA